MSARIQTIIVLGVFALLYAVAASMGGVAWMMPLVLVPFLLVLIGRRDWLFILICLIYYSTLRIPMLQGQAQLYHASLFLFIAIGFGTYVLERRTPKITAPYFFAIMFTVVIAYTMMFRGAGFRFLGGGSGLWGGWRYAEMLLGLGLYLVADVIRLSLRQWRGALVGMVAAGAFPALTEILYVYTKGATGFLYYVFQPLGRIGAALNKMESGSMVRFTMMLQISHIYLIPFFLRKTVGRLRLRGFFFPALAILLGGFSGHRMVLLNVFAYVWTYVFIRSKRRLAYVVLSTTLIGIALLLIGQLAFIFPVTIQRMLSIIPLSNISADVIAEAGSTVSWRVLLWKETIQEVPKYFWLGKGFAYSFELESAQDVRLWANYAIWWAKVQSAYHQGVLSLLVGLGFPGLLAGSAFLFSLCRRHYRIWKDGCLKPGFAAVHYAIMVLILVETGIYFLVYGDAFVSFPHLFFIGAVAEGIYGSGRLDAKEDLEDDVTRA